MLAVSENFKTSINALSRHTRGFIVLDLNKNWDYPFSSVSATTTAVGYSANQACDGRLVTTDVVYTGDFIPTRLKELKVGWKGTAVSDEDGYLSATETLTITYSEEIASGNFWIIFPAESIGTEFTVSVYVDAAWIEIANVTGNSSSMYNFTTTAQTFTQMKIDITRVNGEGKAAQVIECGAVTTIVLSGGDYLMSLELLEEAQASGTTPFGAVSSNECSLELANRNRVFIPSNPASPFYGLLRPKLRFKGYLGVETTTDSLEVVPLGTFTIEDWKITGGASTLNVNGYDRLYQLMQTPCPVLRAKFDTTVGDLFEQLFTKLGLLETEYTIDAALYLIVVPYGFLIPGTVGENFQRLCIAGNCTVIANRGNQVDVRSNLVTGSPVDTLTDDNQVVSIDNPQSFLDTYSRLSISQYITAFTTEDTEVLLFSDYAFPVGATTFTDIPVTTYPVIQLTGAQVGDSTDLAITSLSYGANAISFTVTNSGVAEVTGWVRFTGHTLELNSSPIVYDDGVLSEQFIKELSIDNTLLQDTTTISNYKTQIFTALTDPTNRVVLETRGNPALEISDVLNISSAADGFAAANVTILRNILKWDGGLTGSLICRKGGGD